MRTISSHIKCWMCGVTKPNNSEHFYSFFSKERQKVRFDSKCKPCAKKYKPWHKSAVKRERIKFPQKIKSRMAVSEALRKGILGKPKKCEWCSVESKTLHAHHPDYNSPLRIIWLCVSCHVQVHKKAAA